MKILFLTDNFPPEVNAPASRTFEHCVEWVKAGAEVTVITCVPNFPTGKILGGYKNKLYQEEHIEGIKVIRVWSYITANEGFIKRIIDYISFSLTSFFCGLFQKFDIIIATSPQFFTAVSGCFLSIFKRKAWIMEVRDLWPESIKAVSAMKPNNFVFKILEGIEHWLYMRANAIIVVTDAFRESLLNRGIQENKVFVVKNGVLLKSFYSIPKNDDILNRLCLKNKFIVGYIGTHGLAHKLDFIIHSAAQVKDTDIHFLFIGDGAEKSSIIKLASTLKLTNCSFIDSIAKNNIAQYISITDIALVPLKKSDTFKTVIPSKIFENAAMQKPILLGVEGEAKSIIEKYRAGALFEPENEVEFLNAVFKLKKDIEYYKSLQQGCAKLAIDFDRKILAGKMLEIIKQTVAST